MTRLYDGSSFHPVILITGGAGFLGKALIRELLKDEASNILSPQEIRIFDIASPGYLNDKRLHYIAGDVRSINDLEKACDGVDIVFHSAALIDWGQRPHALLHEVNVTGTQNVIQACVAASVKALVYTSSMDVLYNGTPITNGDETLPYPNHYDMAYAETKSIAERSVLEANGMKQKTGGTEESCPLQTCAIRPCGMFGEADPYHVSSFIRMAQKGALTFRIGNGKARFQHVYVGNVAHAHALAAKSLLVSDNTISGKAYFITDFEAKNFFDYMEPIIRGVGFTMPPKKKSIPLPVMYALAKVLEVVSWLLRPFFQFTPVVNRTSVTMVCKDLTFAGEKARRDLGYRPLYAEDDAIARTINYFKEHGPVTQPECLCNKNLLAKQY